MFRKLFRCIFISSATAATGIAAVAIAVLWRQGASAVPMLLIGGFWTIALGLCAINALQLAERFSSSVTRAAASDTPEQAFPELAVLTERIRRQNSLIGEQMGELRRRQDEFMSIISVMQEGFILADAKGTVLSCNSSALRLLGASASVTDASILTMCPDEAFAALVRTGLKGQRAEGIVSVDGKSCQIIINPEMADGRLEGLGVVILDVTEREQRDALRREFTSNVSHELKTPLTTIRGTTELLANGMVRPEDESAFLRSVCDETERLIALVEDILRLSRLDAGRIEEEKRDVDIFEVAKAVTERLSPAAASANVEIRVEGEHAVVWGVPVILDEMICNLADNGIKYNKPGGKVTVMVHREQNGILVCVSDTGIGIPPEHTGRIFERFYRVDKSRSKALGGTGLGLSIVKHAAVCHGAELSVESRLGVGTSVRICFPAEVGN